MKKTIALLTLSLMPTVVSHAKNEDKNNGRPDRVIELHQALEVSKEAYKEAKKTEKKSLNQAKHEAERAEFWEKVEHKKALQNSAPIALTENIKNDDGMIKRAVDAIFNLFR